MSGYKFNNILQFEHGSVLSKGLYLWIWYADKIPPHIGCSVDGSYYSLKVSGKDEALLSDKVLNIIRRKKIPTIFVAVDKEVRLTEVDVVFMNYRQAQSERSTCLTPVIELLGWEKIGIDQLSTLLKYLESNKILGKVFGLNLTEGYTGIPEYGAEDIQNRLRKLENVQIKTGLPSAR